MSSVCPRLRKRGRRRGTTWRDALIVRYREYYVFMAGSVNLPRRIPRRDVIARSLPPLIYDNRIIKLTFAAYRDAMRATCLSLCQRERERKKRESELIYRNFDLSKVRSYLSKQSAEIFFFIYSFLPIFFNDKVVISDKNNQDNETLK